MIRITLIRDAYRSWTGEVVPSNTLTTVFEDDSSAVSWFVEDSYFGEPYTRKAIFERVDDNN